MEQERILVVDDEQGIREQLYWALNDTYEVIRASDPAEALAAVREHRPAAVILDINLRGTDDSRDGIELIPQIIDIEPDAKIIMVTGHGQRENALTCIEHGAYDFFPKPVELDALRTVINRGLYLRRLELEHRQLQSGIDAAGKFEEIVGTSDSMRKIFNFIETVSRNDYTVLITGESGTGKELVARAIHRLSARSQNPFVAINCGAIPETLLESELFGFEKGSFTDAHQRRIGHLEQAESGTVFLDEIGEMSVKLQVKLLRFIEDRHIRRIGGTESIDLDVRIFAATNRDLAAEVAAGNFREDLYYRLSVLHIDLPPLRERGEDVIFLANYFLNRFAAENNRRGLRFSAKAIQAIDRAPWQGNVRELENKVKRAVIMSENSTIEPTDLGFDELPEDSAELITLQQVKEHAEQKHLKRALAAHGWNISRVSRELEISRTTLYELIDKYRLRRDENV